MGESSIWETAAAADARAATLSAATTPQRRLGNSGRLSGSAARSRSGSAASSRQESGSSPPAAHSFKVRASPRVRASQ